MSDSKELASAEKFFNKAREVHPANKDAAWELYIELMTRVVSNDLELNSGKEDSALESIYKLFQEVRETLKLHGRDCAPCARVAFGLFNEHLRPFASKWHKRLAEGYLMSAAREGRESFNLATEKRNEEFRNELAELQEAVKPYIRQLAEMAGIDE